MSEVASVAGAIPRHVGIIMDGNGRWARARGLTREEGHFKGADSVSPVVRCARKLGCKALTLYAFSHQNWARPAHEVLHLMQLLRRYLIKERAEILDNGIRFTTVGDVHRLPAYVRAPLAELKRASAHNTDMVLCLALSYGGREMITQAVQTMCRAAAAGTLDPESVTPDTLTAHLESSALLPPMDLLIRTSGERRISNFFLWEIAYAELYFTETLWPDFRDNHLMEAIREYGRRERRFGLTSEQVAPLAPASGAAATGASAASAKAGSASAVVAEGAETTVASSGG